MTNTTELRADFEKWFGEEYPIDDNGYTRSKYQKSSVMELMLAAYESGRASAVPEGFQIVPKEPTREMIWACKARFIPRIALPAFVAAYKTMLAAAPQEKEGV